MADIPTLVDQMWDKLLLSTISGHKYDLNGQPNTGRWGEAKALRDQIKAAARVSPTVSITSPAEGQKVTGKITITGTAG